MTREQIDRLLDGHAAECVEELMATVSEEGGDPWFFVVRLRMVKLLKEYDRERERRDEVL